MEQWFLKITAYADELLSGHAALGKWPEHVLQMQKNWIGKSIGAHVRFGLEGEREADRGLHDPHRHDLRRDLPRRLGRTSDRHRSHRRPEGEGARRLGRPARSPRCASAATSARPRRTASTPAGTAVNPFTGERVPVWIANYVLMDYGTGAIMAVPAHDARDFEFARKYGLPIRTVIVPPEKAGGRFDAEPAEVYRRLGRPRQLRALRRADLGRRPWRRWATTPRTRASAAGSTIFRLRDWGISRQRYWGTPIPVIYCDTCGIVGVPDDDLPVELPFDVKLTGEEGSPLEQPEASSTRPARSATARPAARRTRWTPSSIPPGTSSATARRARRRCPSGPKRPRPGCPVDLYIGGVEHAILHLIYSRFFTKVLRDFGLTEIATSPSPTIWPRAW